MNPMSTPTIRNKLGEPLDNYTDQLAYGVSQDPLGCACVDCRRIPDRPVWVLSKGSV